MKRKLVAVLQIYHEDDDLAYTVIKSGHPDTFIMVKESSTELDAYHVTTTQLKAWAEEAGVPFDE